MKFYKIFYFGLLFPHYLCYNLVKNKTVIKQDISFWCQNYNHRFPDNLGYLLWNFSPFRSVFYYRVKQEKNWINKVLIFFCKIILKPQVNLYITTEKIGPGLFFLHGFSTIVSAKQIGNNCWINQQVTIGYTTPDGAPTIGDNVKIFAGAKVLGDITIGKNVVIGANAVVVKNVPDNTTVVGVPAYIIKKDGVKTRIPL